MAVKRLELRAIPTERALPFRVLQALDQACVACFDVQDRVVRANCVLALAQFYFSVGENNRAAHLLDWAAGSGAEGGFLAKVFTSPGQRQSGGNITPWEVEESRRHLLRASLLLEQNQVDDAINEALECRILLGVSGVSEEIADFTSILWLGLTAKVAGKSLKHVATNWRISENLQRERDRRLPNPVWDVYCYTSKAWFWFGMDSCMDAEEMLAQVVIPSLRECQEWPGLRLRAWGVQSLLAAKNHDEAKVREALSMAEEVLGESKEILYRKFYSLVRMEAMTMLGKEETAQKALGQFLSEEGKEPKPEGVQPESQSGATPEAADNSYYISPSAYLRSVAVIAWSCFRHPFSTTVVDLTTGELVENQSH